jgi:dolichol-phosphate mannosyltransferase
MTINGEQTVETQKFLTICIPVLNECQNILPLYERLKQVADLMREKCLFEFIFTDNASTDSTWEVLEKIGKLDSRVRAFRFTKNIGFQNSILFNISQAKGDAIVQIDADLQDPPEMIEEFFNLWVKGNMIVYGVRTSRKESWLMNSTRKWGYRIIDVLSEHKIPPDAGDFRLIDRKVADILKLTKTPDPYLRGIVSGYGFKQIGIEYARSERTLGVSKFNLIQVIKLGFNAINNHSDAPSKIGLFIGFSSLSASIFGFIFYVFLKIKDPSLPVGFVTAYILILFSVAINSLLLSLILNYLKRIYLIIRGEPTQIVIKTIN